MIAAVVLAAGLARRMGRQKLLLQLQGKPVVRWAVERIGSYVEDVVVVTGADDAAIREALADLTVRFVVNPRPQDGQGTSIAVGVNFWASSIKRITVLPSATPFWKRCASIALRQP